MNFIKVSVIKTTLNMDKDGNDYASSFETAQILLNANHILSITPVTYSSSSGNIKGYYVRTHDKLYKVVSIPPSLEKLLE